MTQAKWLWDHARWLVAALILAVTAVLVWVYGSRTPLRVLLNAQAREREAAMRAAKTRQEAAALTAQRAKDLGMAQEASAAAQRATDSVAKAAADRARALDRIAKMDDDRLANDFNQRRGRHPAAVSVVGSGKG